MLVEDGKRFEKNDEHKKKDSDCVCVVLSNIVERQKEKRQSCRNSCTLETEDKPDFGDTIPFILQTPYGHPFFTWGELGTDKCFVTVFFKVIKVDCKKNCAVFELLKPNVSIIDPDTGCVETEKICEVDFVKHTEERILVDLSCYSAVKFISPKFIKKHASPHSNHKGEGK